MNEPPAAPRGGRFSACRTLQAGDDHERRAELPVKAVGSGGKRATFSAIARATSSLKQHAQRRPQATFRRWPGHVVRRVMSSLARPGLRSLARPCSPAETSTHRATPRVLERASGSSCASSCRRPSAAESHERLSPRPSALRPDGSSAVVGPGFHPNLCFVVRPPTSLWG